MVFWVMVAMAMNHPIIDSRSSRVPWHGEALNTAFVGYLSEYDHLPLCPPSGTLTNDPAALSLLETLSGKTADNPRQINFLALPEGHSGRNGLLFDRTSHRITGLADPWGHPYRLYIDSQRTGSIPLPSGKTVTGKLAVIVSDGPDGEPGTRDDVTYGLPLPPPGFWQRVFR